MLTDKKQDYIDRKNEKRHKLYCEDEELHHLCDRERARVPGLLAELEAVCILRKHLPATLQYRVDELEWTLRHIEQMQAHLDGWRERMRRLEEAERAEHREKYQAFRQSPADQGDR